MPPKVLIEGPFESDYSLAIVNRNLAYGMLDAGYEIGLHQRDNTTSYPPSAAFLQLHPRLAAGFQTLDPGARPDIHTRYIYPPHCDRMIGSVRAFHCYGWEESAFPQQYAMGFDSGLDLVTVMSRYVMQVLRDNGVTVPIEVVGLGADHILGSSPVPIDGLQTGAFNFLHVSSCFPRKGADVLVRAFCEEFRRSEDVQLIIKTFANPHNKIEELVAEADRRYRGHPPIQVIWDSLAAGQMRFLLENANCLVSASRGEGFGLPVAEAMLVGCPVIATIHGGQADLCSAEWCWPVEFQIAPAKTHLTEGPYCYGWEESAFPQQYAMGFDSGLDLVTVMSRYVMQVLRDNGVTVPIEVVGLGADHILGSSPVPIDGLQTGAFNFLHVSSCFPRKGADVLVRAFCEEFRRSEDVQLIIKTFANPHNKIEELVAEADRRYRGHPPIQVIWDSLAAGQMRFLLENANCLVSASRGEGFGLPVAEAMLVGCPVIATIHGGQADLCSAEWCWPVEFQIAPAKTHLTEGPYCYGWEESAFPQQYAMGFDSGLDLVTVMSRYVMQVLRDNGVTVPIEVVGLGADHILGSSPVPIDGLQTGAFNFLHVSSCFPRKGADVLVRAFCEEFRRSEDVQLIIKTFANPHNKIEELVAEADRRYRGHPPIQVIWDSLAAGQMRFLLENANCLVSASRGEGFGLPVAEAMLVGCPVIATIHGGQADLCSAEWCWPVEFQIAPAKTHLTEGPSFWAQPSVDST